MRQCKILPVPWCGEVKSCTSLWFSWKRCTILWLTSLKLGFLYRVLDQAFVFFYDRSQYSYLILPRTTTFHVDQIIERDGRYHPVSFTQWSLQYSRTCIERDERNSEHTRAPVC